MRRNRFLGAIILGLCGAILLPAGTLKADGEVEAVAAKLDQLFDWMGETEKAAGWKKYLQHQKLVEQLAKGPAADRSVVRQILAKFEADHQGLDRWRFVEAREAIAEWLENLPHYTVEQLPEAARDAKQNFRSISAEQAADAKAELVAAANVFDRWAARGSVIDRMRWKQYLRWEELQQQLQSDEKPDFRVLQAIRDQFFMNERGLEMPKFTAVREALDRYLAAAIFAFNPESQEFYQRYLDDLADRLESFAANPNSEDAIVIGKTLGWLERFGQAEELVAAARHHYWQPNLYLQVSERFLQAGVERDVVENKPISDVILGTSIYGTAHMEGQVGLELVPSDTRAAMALKLTGTTWSNNVGYNGPVTIYSNGVTSVDGTKRIYLSSDGLTSDYATAVCATNSTINRIAAGMKLIRTIAWNRAMASKSQAERIASQHAASRVAGELDVAVAEMLEQGQHLYDERFRLPLVRRGGFPPVMHTSSTRDNLFVRMTQALDSHLAAADSPPEMKSGDDILVRLHESMVANMSQALFGGVKLTDEDAQRMVEDLTGEVPEELKIGPEDDPWSITFANERPLEATFDDNQYTMVVRAKQFTRADQTIRKAILITAHYNIEKTEQGLLLTRQGDVEVNLARSGSQSVAEIALKSFIKVKFEALFKPEFVGEGLELKGNFANAGTLRVKQLHCDDGWLGLGWSLPPKTARTARAE